MSDSDRRSASTARTAGRSMYEEAVDVVLTGIVVIVPIVITIYILQTALNFVSNALAPVIKLLAWAGIIDWVQELGVLRLLVEIGIYHDVFAFLTELVAAIVLTVVVVAVGLIARNHYGEQLIDYFDYLMGAVPAFGTIYQSFRRMGDVMLESGVENFREVKLVEFPRDGVYVLGFVTNQAPLPIQQGAEIDGMTTLFLPLAPNPVMGGFLTYIPDERIRDVDMTVEDAVRTIVTSGIATEDPEGEYRQLSKEEIEELNDPGKMPANQVSPDETGAEAETGDEAETGGGQ